MAAKIFCCYAREDEALLNKLWAHLRPLQQEGLIELWHDRDISAGAEWDREISEHLNAAQIILLLVSPDFMNSDYCYGAEMKRTLERHARGEARVIPIILRPIHWKGAPFGQLQVLPTDAKPITDPYWYDLDMAFFNVAKGIRKVVIELSKSSISQPDPLPEPHGVSRRAVLGGGLAGLAVVAVAGGELLWPILHPQHPTPTPLVSPTAPPTSLSTPTPTPITLGTLLYTYRGHSSYVFAVAWSPDSKGIASGSDDQTVQVWDAANGGHVYIYRGHSEFVPEFVVAVAWSPDGKRIASGGADQTVQVWVAG